MIVLGVSFCGSLTAYLAITVGFSSQDLSLFCGTLALCVESPGHLEKRLAEGIAHCEIAELEYVPVQDPCEGELSSRAACLVS